MVSLEEIREYADKIVERFRPERIILFGSHAYGRPGPDSDVDLLVVMEFEGRPQELAFEIRRALSRSFPLDLIVRRPEDIERRIRLGDPFIKEVIEKGLVLYDRTRTGVGGKG